MSVAAVTLESPTQAGLKNPCSDLDWWREEGETTFSRTSGHLASGWLDDTSPTPSSPHMNL